MKHRNDVVSFSDKNTVILRFYNSLKKNRFKNKTVTLLLNIEKKMKKAGGRTEDVCVCRPQRDLLSFVRTDAGRSREC